MLNFNLHFFQICLKEIKFGFYLNLSHIFIIFAKVFTAKVFNCMVREDETTRCQLRIACMDAATKSIKLIMC